jgi:uncharacterized RDD family membrane protein YckC
MPETKLTTTIKAHVSERVKGERRYNPHGTMRMEELAGLKLASFKHRMWAFVIDWVILSIVMMPFGSLLGTGLKYFYPEKAKPAGQVIHYETTKPDPDDPTKTITEKKDIPVDEDEEDSAAEKKKKKLTEEIFDPFFGLLYYGFFVWATNGRTPGKKLMGVRVVSLVRPRITLWQSCERALGYGASALEAGFGFFQFFINPNRCCVHDRIAETIVIEDPPRETKAAREEAKRVKEVARLEAEAARALDEEVLSEGASETQNKTSAL